MSNHTLTALLDTCSDIHTICQPLKRLGITYFSYTKSYPNGMRVYLTTLAQPLENHFTKKYYLHCGNESHPRYYDKQIVLWSTFSNQECYRQAALQCNIDHGINFFEPTNDYCESYGFATTRDNKTIYNTYFNNIDFLQQFIQYFKATSDTILRKAEEHTVALPFNDSYKEIKSYKLDTESDLLTAKNNQGIQLPPRQQECAQYILLGKSAKYIANELKLSPRTIEHYIANMKNRLGCRNKYELILKLRGMV